MNRKNTISSFYLSMFDERGLSFISAFGNPNVFVLFPTLLNKWRPSFEQNQETRPFNCANERACRDWELLERRFRRNF